MDEYPTEGNLEIIKKFNLLKNDVMELLDYIEAIWWQPDWGFVKKGKRVIKLQLHTGGWSGNEDIINALQQNFVFWSMYWVKHIRGGHYFFKITLRR